MKINARILALVVAGAFGLAALPGDIAISPAQACCQSFSPAPAPVYRAPSPSAPLARPPAIVVRPTVHQLTAHLFTPPPNRIFLAPKPPLPGKERGGAPPREVAFQEGEDGEEENYDPRNEDLYEYWFKDMWGKKNPSPKRYPFPTGAPPGGTATDDGSGKAEEFVEIEQEDDYRLSPDPADNGSIAGDLQPPPVKDPWGDF